MRKTSIRTQPRRGKSWILWPTYGNAGTASLYKPLLRGCTGKDPRCKGHTTPSSTTSQPSPSHTCSLHPVTYSIPSRAWRDWIDAGTQTIGVLRSRARRGYRELLDRPALLMAQLEGLSAFATYTPTHGVPSLQRTNSPSLVRHPPSCVQIPKSNTFLNKELQT